MPANFPLDLDPTGQNPNNLIPDELHTLGSTPVRAVATRHGPFVCGPNSPLVKSGATVLQRGIDYQVAELHQEATLRYSKEIAEIILILNPAVGPDVTVTYQALGGPYAHSSAAIANLYQTVMQDNRPIDWANVKNKPADYLPTVHRHLLDDIYGFEPVVDYLERIKSAITLGQTQLVLNILEELLSQFRCKELPKVLPSNRMMQYDAFLYFMSRKKLLSNVWIDVPECSWVKGQSAMFEIETSDYPVGTTLYWSFYNPHGPVALISNTSGTITTNGGIVQVQIYVPGEANVNNEKLYLGVKEDPDAEDYLAVTYQIKVQEYVTASTAYGQVYSGTVLPTIFGLTFGTFADNDELRLRYLLSNP
ncbi:MAG: hypothetical protein PHN51_10300 [Candidatus Nanopelagicales bacterium]|nr:hypothetical protein [Candidatus Nanopelagicales bacterium]